MSGNLNFLSGSKRKKNEESKASENSRTAIRPRQILSVNIPCQASLCNLPLPSHLANSNTHPPAASAWRLIQPCNHTLCSHVNTHPVSTLPSSSSLPSFPRPRTNHNSCCRSNYHHHPPPFPPLPSPLSLPQTHTLIPSLSLKNITNLTSQLSSSSPLLHLHDLPLLVITPPPRPPSSHPTGTCILRQTLHTHTHTLASPSPDIPRPKTSLRHTHTSKHQHRRLPPPPHHIQFLFTFTPRPLDSFRAPD